MELSTLLNASAKIYNAKHQKIKITKVCKNTLHRPSFFQYSFYRKWDVLFLCSAQRAYYHMGHRGMFATGCFQQTANPSFNLCLNNIWPRVSLVLHLKSIFWFIYRFVYWKHDILDIRLNRGVCLPSFLLRSDSLLQEDGPDL